MEGTNTMLAAPAPLMSTDGNVRTRRSRRGGRRCHARRSSPEAHSAARWPALVQGALRQERASKRTGILQSWMRLQAARAGAKAIILSNHGGRNLDTSRSGLEVLPDVVAALRSGDCVLVKGSLGSRMGLIVDGLMKLGRGG